MEIRNIRHKALRNLLLKNSRKGLPPEYVGKITDIVSYLIEMDDIEDIFALKKYKPHRLSGDRAGYYSFHVSANWRLTFGYDVNENEIFDLDYEDYH